MPDGSYWSKLKFNKKFKKEKLNPIFGGVDKIVLTVRKEGNTINVDQTPLTIRTKEIENDPDAPLIVPDEITKPDILTIQTKQYWQGKISFTSYREDNRIIHPIRVGKNNRERALNFMDAFTKLIRYRGHTFSKEYSNTGVLIDEIFIEIDLREASKRIPPTTKYGSSEYIPTGEFIFKVGKYSGEREWRDGKVKLEGMLARIVAKIELLAQREKEWKEQARISRLKREEEEKLRAEIKKRRDDEVDKFNRLVKLSEQYDKTRIIRQYIEAVKQKAINTNNLTPEKQEWINWATDKADWLDPLINRPDEILDAK
ncbi:hypothetical protein SAMN05443549_11236 [Flavobacterium fluvii]|uniref:Uncharacterized protein n=2 Tax=Flavobacterium fluvii TaxID=468056 RepID=A0A1M5PQK6_9FLAO|nr:hypothetical protein SAMN05443549_11236 [Flavobacterium fluvii]